MVQPIRKRADGEASREKILDAAAHHRGYGKSRYTLTSRDHGIGMVCHMHLRGRDKTFRASYPDGTSEILLMVPNYNFDWQSSYRWAPDSKHFPGGTRIDVIAHFDNSPFNPYQRIRRPTCASACRPIRK